MAPTTDAKTLRPWAPKSSVGGDYRGEGRKQKRRVRYETKTGDREQVKAEGRADTEPNQQ